jgi:TolB-like protein
LPDEPSIAVMPFINTGNDPRQNYFIDGITEDLITDLSNVSGLFVIARNSSFAYKGKAVDVTQVAGELGVRFILQGSLRRDNEQLRINVRLMDGITGRNLWAERYDTELEDLFAVQDEVTRQITSALSVRLTQSERQNLTQRETLDPTSYDEFLKGWERYWRFSREDFAVAEQHFKTALSIDPSNSRAHAGLALIYWQAWRQKWHENFGNPHAGWTRARRELKLAMNNPTPLAHSTQSSMLLINRRYEDAIAEAEKAIQLNKNHAGGYLALADALSYFGRPDDAIEVARKGMRLDPSRPTKVLRRLRNGFRFNVLAAICQRRKTFSSESLLTI